MTTKTTGLFAEGDRGSEGESLPPNIVAGATRFHLDKWHDITSDPVILQNVEGVKIQFDTMPVQDSVPRTYKFNQEHSSFINIEISEMLQKGVIVEQNDITDCFISNIFLRPKPNNKFRMIIDLSDLNEFVTKQHFKMEHLGVAADLLFPGAWLASIDLKEAYYTIPISDEDQKYLCFQWEDKVYRFTCVPFGLSSAPWLFTKTLRPIFSKFHEEGHQGFGYIDDSFIVADSYEKCVESVQCLTELFSQLGFSINTEKSVLKPTQNLTFLGYELNSLNMTISPTHEKKEKVKSSVENLLQDKKPKIRKVASTLGLLNDVCKSTEYGRIYVKRLEIQKILALRKVGKKQFEGRMKISYESSRDLRWWRDNIDSASYSIRPIVPETVLKTDASKSGWGAVCDSQSTGGRWNVQESEYHINILELKAVELGLRSLCSDISGPAGIKVLCDNSTSVSYLKHKGGTKSTHCNEVARRIWKWCETKNIWLVVSHIPGIQNIEADFESRNFTDNTEWALNSHMFKEVCDTWGYPNIDLFASRNNNQLPLYVSWGPDPFAKYVDAFSLNWREFKFVYIFPPFRLIARALQKVQAEKVRAIIVTPMWPGQPWFPSLQAAARETWTFPKRRNNLLQREIGDLQGKSLNNVSIRFHLIF